jgi:hypothetical protein
MTANSARISGLSDPGWVSEQAAAADVSSPTPETVSADVSRGDLPLLQPHHVVRRSSTTGARRSSSSPTAASPSKEELESRHLQLRGIRGANSESSARSLGAARNELAVREAAAQAAVAAVHAVREQMAAHITRSSAAAAAGDGAAAPPAAGRVTGKALDSAKGRASAADAALWAVRKEHASLLARHAALVEALTLRSEGPRAVSGSQLLMTEATAAAAVKLRGHAADRDAEVRRLKQHARSTDAALADTRARLEAAQSLAAARSRELEASTGARDDANSRYVDAKRIRDGVRAQLAALGPEVGLVSSPALLAEMQATQAVKQQLELTVGALKAKLASMQDPVHG